MTDEEFKERVVALLEIIAFGDDDCAHEHARDMGVMGDIPGAKMKCLDCGQLFSRIAEEPNG